MRIGCRPRSRPYDLECLPATVEPYDFEQFGDHERDELVEKLADRIDEEGLVVCYDWADPPEA